MTSKNQLTLPKAITDELGITSADVDHAVAWAGRDAAT